jgi:uncharacterized RDD family membrane protein YckC
MSTNNFLFNFNQNKTSQLDSDYPIASVFKRGIATIIDIHITIILMAIYLEISFRNYYFQKYNVFFEDFYQKFGTKTPKNTPEHLDFIFNHNIFYWTIFIIITTISIGAIYHAYLNSSSWQATIGKRIMKIIITNKKQDRISFPAGLWHYFLTLIPYFFIVFVILYSRKNNLQLYDYLTNNHKVLLIGIIIMLAYQANIFNKKKISLCDYIANIEFYKHKTPYILPWNFKLKYKKDDKH